MTAEPANQVAVAPTSAAVSHWVRALPVAVLLVAIAAQAVLMLTVNVDRQAGSGFAMFSSVDFAGSRSVIVTATFDDRPVRVSVPAYLDDQVDELLYAPTDARARELAATLAEHTWGPIIDNPDIVALDGVGWLEDINVTVQGLTADGHEIGSRVIAQGELE